MKNCYCFHLIPFIACALLAAMSGFCPRGYGAAGDVDLSFDAGFFPGPPVAALRSVAVQPDGSVRFTAFPVRTLITIAYRAEGIQRFDQLIGGPSWIATDRFDIAGKAGEAARQNMGPNTLPAMLRSLLSDRFRLRAHNDTRNLPAFALVLARPDGKPGLQLRESTVECPTGPATDAQPDRWCGIRTVGGVMTGRAASMWTSSTPAPPFRRRCARRSTR